MSSSQLCSEHREYACDICEQKFKASKTIADSGHTISYRNTPGIVLEELFKAISKMSEAYANLTEVLKGGKSN